MQRDRRVDDRALALQAGRVEAGAAADRRRSRARPVSSDASAAAVAVLPIPISPSDEAVDAVVGELRGELAARGERGSQLGAR